MVVIKTSSVCEAPDKSDCLQLTQYLSSKKLPELVTALNVLLEATFDHEENYALGNDGNEVVLGLVRAFEFALGYEKIETHTKNLKRKRVADFHEEKAKLEAIIRDPWNANLDLEDGDDQNNTSESDDEWYHWTRFCVNKLRATKSYSSPDSALSETSLKLVEAITLVIRNLSFVAANLRFLSHSVEMIRMLGVCLYFRSGKTNQSTSSDITSSSTTTSSRIDNDSICLYALDTLTNLAPFLDLSGRKLFTDKMLVQSNTQTNSLIPKHGYSQAYNLGMGGVFLSKKIDSIYDVEPIPDNFHCYILDLCKDHILATVSLFPAIQSVFQCNNNQSLVVSLLDFLKEMVENSDVRVVLLNSPSYILNCLVDLLWVPRLGPDSLDYVDPLTNVVSRVTALKFSGYDATIDYDVRDRSLELLDLFTSLSPQLKQNILEQNSPKIFNYLLPICSSKVGRGDISQVAIKLLANLAMASSQDIDPSLLMYVESKIVMLSASDPNIANIACNSIFNN